MSELIILPTSSTSSLLATEKPGICAACGMPRFLFVNRDGRTLCVECSGKELQDGVAA